MASLDEKTSEVFQKFEADFKRYVAGNLRTDGTTGADAAAYIEVREETPESFASKIATLRDLLRNAKHAIVYTGAGVSTSGGLPDYRGPKGVWTRLVSGEEKVEASPEARFEEMLKDVQPTPTHRWIAEQVDSGRVQHVMSTNVDNLHVRSGLQRRTRGADSDGVTLSELHGNSLWHECTACGGFFERSSPVGQRDDPLQHELSDEVCAECGGAVRDFVVSFHSTHEDVPSMEGEYDRSWVQCVKADVMLVLGSSLSVPTSCDLVDEAVENGGCAVVIVNRQRTPKDHLASLVIHSDCDDVIAALSPA